MENASKALLIAGAILISILIIAIGMYIYSSSQGSIDSAMSSMDTQEIEAFNKEWTNYEGRMTGSQVKSMINRMVANADTYRDEDIKIIDLYCQATNGGAYTQALYPANATADQQQAYVNSLNTAYTAILAKHTYRVVISHNTSGLIDRITVNFDATNNAAQGAAAAPAAPAAGGGA